MEILSDERGAIKKDSATTPPQANNNGCGQILITFVKIIGWALGIAWLLAIFGLVIGFIVLLTAGFFDTSYLTGYEGMASPVLFGGLLCAVIALAMGIVADFWFKLLRGKKIDMSKFLVAGILWLIFTIWLTFACVRNADNWGRWATEAEMRIEQWEEDVEDWAEGFELQMEAFELQMEAFEEQIESTLENGDRWDASVNLTLEGGLDVAKVEYLADKYPELEVWEDRLEQELLYGRKVEISIDNYIKESTLTRTITIVTEKKSDTITTIRSLKENTTIN